MHLSYILLGWFVLFTAGLSAQDHAADASADSVFYITAWGSEPFWSFECKEQTAISKNIRGNDSMVIYTLSERIYNTGFTNERVDTYVFTSTDGEVLTLILVKDEICSCGFDMSDGQSAWSVYLYSVTNGGRKMLLGCARVAGRKE